MSDLIKREDAIKYCKSKAEHYRKRLARIEAQGDAISYDPTEQINGFKDEIAIYESFVQELEEIPSAEEIMYEEIQKADIEAKAYAKGFKEGLEARKQGEWIPCSERLPEDIRPVLVTWKNNDPASYYQYIVGKHFIGTAHYHRGKWYWYSSVTEDLLAEYGKCDSEEFDEAIEAVAWMPLPKPWEGADNE